MSGLVKAKEYKVEDSNVAGLGGKENKDLVKSVAKDGEPAWRRHADYASGKVLEGPEAVKDAKGFKHHVEIWRIEKFKVQFWPREKIGEFFSGDSYIILHTTNEERDMTGLPASAKKAAGESKVQFDLHFWLGKDTTQDEMGTAAYKTVELDTLLDDVPVQHREVQGHESALFLRIFSELYKCGGLRYQEGGVDSGFKHVEPEKYTPRLMHLKGKKKVRINQVAMSMSSLNSGDLFILDQGLLITVWTGNSAGMFEKNKGRESADAMRQSRAGKAVVKNVREDDSADNEDLINFYKALGGKPGDKIKSAAEGGVDDEEEKADTAKTQLWRLSDASGSLKFTKEKEGGIKLGDFKSDDVFVFDAGFQIFVWVGKGATKQEKDNAMINATKYLTDQKRPNHLAITRELEGAETPAFQHALQGK